MMRKPMCSCGCLLAALLVLGGCAAQDTGNSASDGNVCISVRAINGFSPLSDREVLVTAGVNDRYLFTVIGVCSGLRSANRIAVTDATSRICNDGFGRIAFRDFGLGRQVCRVGEIEAVPDRETAEQMVDARRAARREAQPRR